MIEKYYRSSTLDKKEAAACAARLHAYLKGEVRPTLNRIRQNFVMDAVKGLEEGAARYADNDAVCLAKGGYRTSFERLLEGARWVADSAVFAQVCPNGAVVSEFSDGTATETCLHDALDANGMYLLPVATSSFTHGAHPWYTRGADERAANLHRILGDSAQLVIIAGISEKAPNGGVGYLRLSNKDDAREILRLREAARNSKAELPGALSEICDCDWCGFNRRSVAEELPVVAAGEVSDDV